MESISDGQSPYSADDLFDDILWYITCLIDEKMKDIQNSMPEPYSVFLNHVIQNKIPLVTFNYDLIIEKTIRSIASDFRYGLEEPT